MKKLLAALFLFATAFVFGQQKHALVIGNSNYKGIPSLKNPANDANDMEAALKGLGFTVDKVLDGSLGRMEMAVLDFAQRLGASRNAYGFFYYAGHGMQSSGENYLIPVEAENIRGETHLRQRTVSLQFVLDCLDDAGNELNMIVLDACRDNRFGWDRSGSRGFSAVTRAPAGSIIMYATAANTKAKDGEGRNSPFTDQLLKNLKTPGLNVRELFDRTGEGVIRESGGEQHPELSIRYFTASSAYLGQPPKPGSRLEPVADLKPEPKPEQKPESYPNVSKAREHYERGWLFWKRRDWDLAILEHGEAIRFAPDFAEAYYGRGIAYSDKGDHDRAIADYSQAIRLGVDGADVYFFRGVSHENKGDYDDAIADYSKAIRLNPSYATAYNSRSNAYLIKGNKAKANADHAMAKKLRYGR